jgi:hypothetical protein
MFEMPNDISGLAVNDLSGLLASATEEFNSLNTSEDVSDETLARMASLADSIETLNGKITELSAAETVELAVEEPVEATVEVAEVVPTAVERKAALASRVPALIAAGISQPSTTSLVIPEAKPLVTITAAADVQGFAGQALTVDTLSQAIHMRARRLVNSPGRRDINPVASIQKYYAPEYDLTRFSMGSSDSALDGADVWDAIAKGTTPNALTASGGWCAPSETLYDLFEVECTRDQLFMLPGFRIPNNRGGIRWPIFVPHDEDFDPSWVWTETDDIVTSGTKPCILIPCPEFTECRADAVGICIQAGNLMNIAYPEQIRWFVARAMRAWERANALRQLNIVIADSVPVVLTATFGAASAIISALLLQAADYREENGLCCGERLDVIFPCLVSDLVKADIARQDGTLSIGNLPSDADVRAWFAAANLNVTFINHWQRIDSTPPATTWPASVQFLLSYPGSWVRFDNGRLDLGVIRDSVLNATNDFTLLWFEEFYCVGRRGPQSRIVTVPTCPLGEVGGRNPSSGEVTCPTP